MQQSTLISASPNLSYSDKITTTTASTAASNIAAPRRSSSPNSNLYPFSSLVYYFPHHKLPSLDIPALLRSRPAALFLLLASLFLLLLLHQIILPKPPSDVPPSPSHYTPLRHAAGSTSTNHVAADDQPAPSPRPPLPAGDDDQTPAETRHRSSTGPPLDENGDETRSFRPYGSAAALYVVYGAYRGGPNTFAVVGLASKPLYIYGKPGFECYWVPSRSSSLNDADTDDPPPIKSKIARAMLPDWGFGRVYTVVVVNCTFEDEVGTSPDRRGGQLVLYASHGDGLGKASERIVALTEDEHAYNASKYKAPYPYEFVYCGSPLFSDLNAQRMREWIAYHVMLFGPRSHFIFHDAGGMHEGVRAVLEPWKKMGFITIQNVTQTSQYDGYYYNQFLINNDCLHRTKFMADWTFFFDVDEYIYIGPKTTLRAVLHWHANNTLVGFKQLRMSDSICQFEEPKDDHRWTFEKLVYGEQFRDIKYAVQARRVFATGVHYSQRELGHMEGNIGWAWWPHMHFYHYHNTINKHGKLCQNITNNSSSFTLNGNTYDLDTSMVSLAPLVKQFEHKQIGHFRNTSTTPSSNSTN